MPGYWLWSKLIVNLADIGYTESQIGLFCYDWRLDAANLERRDRFLTRLRLRIEELVMLSGEKAVVVAHSMGGFNWLYFQGWVTEQDPTWIGRHVEAVVAAGAHFLGAPATLPAMLSGEQKFSVRGLGTLISSLVDHKFTFAVARDFVRALGSSGQLLPRGGSGVWGDGSGVVTDAALSALLVNGEPLTMENAIAFLNESMTAPVRALREGSGELGVKAPVQEAGRYGNPLASSFPSVPDTFRLYCAYGTGLPTPRAAAYLERETAEGHWRVNHSYSEGSFVEGFAETDGDGTVPLVSLGYMCAEGWRHPDLRAFNPSGA